MMALWLIFAVASKASETAVEASARPALKASSSDGGSSVFVGGGGDVSLTRASRLGPACASTSSVTFCGVTVILKVILVEEDILSARRFKVAFCRERSLALRHSLCLNPLVAVHGALQKRWETRFVELLF